MIKVLNAVIEQLFKEVAHSFLDAYIMIIIAISGKG